MPHVASVKKGVLLTNVFPSWYFPCSYPSVEYEVHVFLDPAWRTCENGNKMTASVSGRVGWGVGRGKPGGGGGGVSQFGLAVRRQLGW